MASDLSPCTCHHLRRAARRVTQVYDRELAAVGLSLNQYSILRRTRHGPRALGELADEMGMDRTTLSRGLKPLLEVKLLKEVRGEDARQRLVELSATGRKRLEAAVPHWQRAQRAIDDGFGEERIARLHRDLDALVDRLPGETA